MHKPLDELVASDARVGAHLLVLNRQEAVANAATYFGLALDVLSELIDEGTRLEVRILGQGAGELRRVIPIAVLYHRLLAILDSIEVLLRAGQAYGARILTRSLLETSWSLEWMLKDEVELRAHQYYVIDLHQRAEELERSVPGTPAYARLKKALGTQADSMLAINEEEIADVKASRADILRRLREYPELRKVDQEVERRKKKKGGELKWFQLFGGPNTFRDLAERLDHAEEYEVFYRMDSHAVHGSWIQDHISIRDEVAANLPLRNMRDFGRVADEAWTTGFRTTINVLKHFREGELRGFVLRFMPGGKLRWNPPEVEFNLERVRPGA